MCEASTIIYTIVAVAGLYEAERQGDRQKNAARKAAKLQAEETSVKKSVEINERRKRARAERSRLRAMAAESGVGGVSVDTVLNDVDFQAGSDIALIKKDASFAQRGIDVRRQSTEAGIDNPTWADAVGAGLQIGQDYAARNPDSAPEWLGGNPDPEAGGS